MVGMEALVEVVDPHTYLDEVEANVVEVGGVLDLQEKGRSVSPSAA